MSQHDNHEHDDDLRQLYRHGAQEKAPAHLSQKIRHASQQAIKSQSAHVSFLFTLMQQLVSSRGLAFTAVMVIGISVILQIQLEQPEESLPEVFMEFNEPDPLTAPPAQQSEHASEPGASFEQRSVPKPAAPMKRKAEQKLIAEQHQQKLAEKKRSQQAMMKKQKEKSAEERMLRQAPSSNITPLSADSLTTPLQLNSDKSCSELTQAACLSSAKCTLDKTDHQLLCRESRNNCEKGFVQAEQSEQQCTTKDGCELITGTCTCDKNENCQCESMQPPVCQATKAMPNDDD